VPELVEVERYRRLAIRALGRAVASIEAPDAWFLKGGLDADGLASAVVGRSFVDARRIGKLLLLDTDGGPTVGLRFGMTGILVVDGDLGVADMQYSSLRDEPAWDRVGFTFVDGGALWVRDPRRLGAVLLDPDEAALGVDAGAVTPAGLAHVVRGSAAPVKARLMDQSKVAGIGNLLADEILWRASIDPARPAGSLEPAEVRRLHRHVRRTVAELLERGGSHLGDLMASRTVGGRCPKDGVPLERRTVGGRTTWSCPRHQR
jgi:formamidopyrimidine-DNA glycosylase